MPTQSREFDLRRSAGSSPPSPAPLPPPPPPPEPWSPPNWVLSFSQLGQGSEPPASARHLSLLTPLDPRLPTRSWAPGPEGRSWTPPVWDSPGCSQPQPQVTLRTPDSGSSLAHCRPRPPYSDSGGGASGDLPMGRGGARVCTGGGSAGPPSTSLRIQECSSVAIATCGR